MQLTRIKWHLTYWLFPVLCVASVFAPLFISQRAMDIWVVSPFGFLENIPSVFLFIAVGFGIALLRQEHLASIDRRLKYWIIVFIIACIYFSGEDTNWGQYWFGLATPEYFLEHNKVKEINLHNISSWFNQKPRIVTDIWAIVACALVPLGWKWPVKATARVIPTILWPTTRNFVILVGLCLLAEITDKLESAGKLPSGNTFEDIRLSEIQELLIAYLIMLYIAHLYTRVKALKKAH